MITLIIVAKIIGALIGSWVISFIVTLTMFFVDLNVNDPKPFSFEVDFIRGRHLKMNKFVWLGMFILLLILIF